MPKCVTEHYSIAVPSDWEDRSMITWVAPNTGKYAVLPNILCSKAPLERGETLDKFVNRQIKELMIKVKNFDLIHRQDATFGGIKAVDLMFSMTPQGVALQQKQLFFIPEGEEQAIAHTLVATAAKKDFPNLEKSFEDVFRSVTWFK